MSPVGANPGQILQHPDWELATAYLVGGQQRRRDYSDLLYHVSGTSGRLEPSPQSEGGDLEEFNGRPV